MAVYNSFDEWLEHAIVELTDTTEFKQPLIEALKEKLRNQNFKSGVRPLSKQWQAVKSKYGQPIGKRLVGDGGLMNSVKSIRNEYAFIEVGYPHNVKHSQRINKARYSGKRRGKTPKPVDMQTLAYWHLNGEGNLPKDQEFVWLDDGDIAELEEIFVRKFD